MKRELTESDKENVDACIQYSSNSLYGEVPKLGTSDLKYDRVSFKFQEILLLEKHVSLNYRDWKLQSLCPLSEI